MRDRQPAQEQPARPSLGAVGVALIPFVSMCFSVSLWDRIEPMLFGLPFNLCWLIGWIILTPLCMVCAYRLEVARNERHRP